MKFQEIVVAMRSLGATQLLFKELAPNDNSKNQVYLAGSLDILNVLPMGEIRTEVTEDGTPILKAPLSFDWLLATNKTVNAPHAQLILYPQYPEVRFSGFLKGTRSAPNHLMTSRANGRLLFLGVTAGGRIVGHADDDGELLAELRRMPGLRQTGVFRHLPIGTADTSRTRLLQKLAAISAAGWIPAQRLYSDGLIGPCNGTNCGGYTLEAQLGIQPNGRSEPDFEGWELKSHGITRFDRLGVGQLTLMTPEPTGGLYKEDGPSLFVRTFGYADKQIADRLNFSSPHRCGIRNELTGLTLALTEFDAAKGKILDPRGSMVLVDDHGLVAAEWHYASLLKHWNRKHAQAAFVPSLCQRTPVISYRYGDHVRLGEGTDFIRFLNAVSAGAVWYDPGIKLEGASETKPKLKRRSQFRIRSADLTQLYAAFTEVPVQGHPSP